MQSKGQLRVQQLRSLLSACDVGKSDADFRRRAASAQSLIPDLLCKRNREELRVLAAASDLITDKDAKQARKLLDDRLQLVVKAHYVGWAAAVQSTDPLIKTFNLDPDKFAEYRTKVAAATLAAANKKKQLQAGGKGQSNTNRGGGSGSAPRGRWRGGYNSNYASRSAPNNARGGGTTNSGHPAP